MHPFSTPWKHEKTLRFSDVFRKWRKGALRTNGLINVRYYMFPLILSDECNLITFLISLSETLKDCILLSALWSSAESRNKDRSSAESATVVGKYGFLLVVRYDLLPQTSNFVWSYQTNVLRLPLAT